MHTNGYLTTSQRLDTTFAALADPTRRAILARLASGAASVTELARPFAMSQPAISKHLKVLELAGLIERGRDAQRRPCRIQTRPLERASVWLAGYRKLAKASDWRLDALPAELESKPGAIRLRERRRPRRRRSSPSRTSGSRR